MSYLLYYELSPGEMTFSDEARTVADAREMLARFRRAYPGTVVRVDGPDGSDCTAGLGIAPKPKAAPKPTAAKFVSFEGRVLPLPWRDHQREKLYTAERLAFAPFIGSKAVRRYETVAECQRRVDAIMGSETAKNIACRFGSTEAPRPVKVDDGAGCRFAGSYGGTIKLPRHARIEWVILHELAHELTPRIVSHQWPFAATYLALVSRFLGTAAERALRAAFRAHGVKYLPPRGR